MVGTCFWGGRRSSNTKAGGGQAGRGSRSAKMGQVGKVFAWAVKAGMRAFGPCLTVSQFRWLHAASAVVMATAGVVDRCCRCCETRTGGWGTSDGVAKRTARTSASRTHRLVRTKQRRH